MALVKTNRSVEHVSFGFGQDGSLASIEVVVDIVVLDEVSGQEEGRIRKSFDAFPSLTATQRSQARALATKLLTIANQA